MRIVPARALVAATLAALLTAPATAGIDNAGTTAASFLTVGSNPGVLAMGGAGLSLEGGLAAFDWNPATLARLGGSEAIFSHAALGDQTAQEWGGFGGRLRFAGLSGAVTGLFQNEGSFDGRDAFGNPTGTFNASSMALGVGMARAVGPFVTAGFGLKYASEDLGGVRGSGVTFDGGLQVRSGGFGFGAAAQNLWGQMKYGSAIYGFPTSYGLGVSYAHEASGLSVALDVNFPTSYYSDVRGGVEWRWNDRFALRTGYRAELGAASGDPLAGPTFGMGAGAHGMWLDYGYLVGGGGAGQHRIGITFHPGMGEGPPEERERHGREFGQASTDAMPPTGAGASASAESKGGAAASGAPAKSSMPVTPSAPATASVPVNPPAPTSASAKANAPATASAPAKASAPGPASASANANAKATASAPSKASSNASAPASASGGGAAGPVAMAATPPSSPPTHAQRAKAAGGTSAARASDRKAAALAPADATPPASAPAAAHASATKRDSSAATKTAAAPARAAGAAKPDTTVARPAAPMPSSAREPVHGGPRPEKVRVKSGQTLADIARLYGTSVAAIMMENDMTTQDVVHPGQVIKLPRK